MSMNRVCGKCAAVMGEGEQFCVHCGAKYEEPPSAAVAPSAFVFCTNCGTKLQSDAAFCENCGEKTQINGPVSNGAPLAPGGVASVLTQKNLKIAAALVAVLAIAIAGFNIAANSGRGYLLTTLKKTQKAYQKEVNTLISRNPVLKAAAGHFKSSNTQQISIPFSGSMTLRDDKKAKAWQMDIRSDYMPVSIRTFLTDDTLIVGSPSILMLEANPKALGTEFGKLADNLSYLLQYADVSASQIHEATDILDAYDLSYTSVQTLAFITKSPDFIYFNDMIVRQVSNLIKRADYKKERSTVEIDGKSVNTNRIVLTADAAVMKSWLEEDLLPEIKASKEIRKYWDAYESARSMDYWHTPMDFDEAMDELETGVDDLTEEMTEDHTTLLLSLEVYKGTIVSVKAAVHSDDYEDNTPSYEISALGAPYRLNDIRMKVYDGYDEDPYEYAITGDHFSETVFSTVLSYSDYADDEEISVEWDLKETRNNLVIESDGDELEMTLALDGQDVKAETMLFSWTLGALNASIELPGNTTKISELSVSDIMNQINMMSELF